MPEALGNPSFRRLWLAGLLSMAGSEISRLGLFLYLFHERESIVDLALLVALKTLSGALAAPAAGLLVDRCGKRRLLVACDLAQTLYLLFILIWPTYGMIYAVAVLQSITSAVFEPAKRAAIPLVVDQGQIPEANGLDHGSRSLMMIVGPILGAELFLQAGLIAVLAADAVSFLASAALLTGVEVRRVAQEVVRKSPLVEIRAGWAYFRRNGLVVHLTLLFFVSMLCGGIWVPLAPFFIRDFLGAGDRVLGWQLAAFGLGGVIGGLLAPRLSALVKTGVILFVALIAEAIQLTVYSLVPDVTTSCLILFVWGIAVSGIAVSSYSILQTRVQERYLGRVFSLVSQGENVAMLLAMGLAMGLQSVLQSHLIFLAAGIFYLGTVATASLTPGGRAIMVTR